MASKPVQAKKKSIVGKAVRRLKKTKPVSRLRARARGRRFEGRKKKLRQLILERLASMPMEIVPKEKNIPPEELMKRIALNFQDTAVRQRGELFKIASRISARYTLDSLGLSASHDRVKRKAVMQIVKRFSDKFALDAQLVDKPSRATIKEFETGIQLTLGKKKGGKFLYQFLARQAYLLKLDVK
jgi:hypothetical protein